MAPITRRAVAFGATLLPPNPAILERRKQRPLTVTAEQAHEIARQIELERARAANGQDQNDTDDSDSSHDGDNGDGSHDDHAYEYPLGLRSASVSEAVSPACQIERETNQASDRDFGFSSDNSDPSSDNSDPSSDDSDPSSNSSELSSNDSDQEPDPHQRRHSSCRQILVFVLALLSTLSTFIFLTSFTPITPLTTPTSFPIPFKHSGASAKPLHHCLERDGIAQYPLGIRDQLDAMAASISYEEDIAIVAADWLMSPPFRNKLYGLFPTWNYLNAEDDLLARWRTYTAPGLEMARIESHIDAAIAERTQTMWGCFRREATYPELLSCLQGWLTRRVWYRHSLSELLSRTERVLAEACSRLTRERSEVLGNESFLRYVEVARKEILERVEELARKASANSASFLVKPLEESTPYWVPTDRADGADIDGGSRWRKYSLLTPARAQRRQRWGHAEEDFPVPSAEDQKLLHRLMSDWALSEFLGLVVEAYAVVDRFAVGSCERLPSFPTRENNSDELLHLHNHKASIRLLPRLFRPDSTPFTSAPSSENPSSAEAPESMTRRRKRKSISEQLVRDILRNSTRTLFESRSQLSLGELRQCIATNDKLGPVYAAYWEFWAGGASPHWWINTSDEKDVVPDPIDEKKLSDKDEDNRIEDAYDRMMFVLKSLSAEQPRERPPRRKLELGRGLRITGMAYPEKQRFE